MRQNGAWRRLLVCVQRRWPRNLIYRAVLTRHGFRGDGVHRTLLEAVHHELDQVAQVVAVRRRELERRAVHQQDRNHLTRRVRTPGHPTNKEQRFGQKDQVLRCHPALEEGNIIRGRGNKSESYRHNSCPRKKKLEGDIDATIVLKASTYASVTRTISG